MCKTFEEVRDERSIDIAKDLIEMGIMSIEQIAKITRLSLDKVKELAGA